MLRLLRKMFDTNEKEIKRLSEMVDAINALEPEMEGMADEQLQGLTPAFRQRLASGESLEDLLPEAFAAVREAAKRTIGQRHYDVQLMGGIVLHEGRIAEMKTGEGKTLAATLPVYLNALTGRGVHVITVNDYLASRDAAWMGSIYRFLGLTVGTIVHGLDFDERQQAYAADITYGTNNEFGFDYLRDNMVTHASQLVQRELYYCIVDEVDSILIDEARTPLIISGAVEQDTNVYYEFAKIATALKIDEHYTVDEKARTVSITEEGVERVEGILKIDNLYDEAHFEKSHYVNQAIKAKELFKRDRDYVVKDGEVIIVDEFTGRLMVGRRYSDGLHQSIEAKENVRVERESQTMATITFQNYFRMYEKLAGMTGTAETEEAEFQKIYGMDVVVIPTNLEMVREDHSDLVYKTAEAKYKAIVEDIVETHQTGRPILVGTISIERSELLHRILKKRGIPHQVLNAKYHEKEAEIVAQAGRLGAVTIATNMAGRGTDILLGGNPEFLAREQLRKEMGDGTNGADPDKYNARYEELFAQFKAQTEDERRQVLDLGGLYIIGTERHESRRIDNQLRGRAGRQGDPGASRFYVSLEDDLMRLFGSERIASIMGRLGWDDDHPIEHNQITRSIENAQRKVETHFFEMREQVLKYDDVMNRQREVIYGLRRRVLEGGDMQERITEMMTRWVEAALDQYCDEKTYEEEWDLESFARRAQELTALEGELSPSDLAQKSRDEVQQTVMDYLLGAYEEREADIGAERLREIERMIMLQAIDRRWIDHLRDMDELREGIGLRAYGQRDPLLEYQFEAFQMFQQMMDEVEEAVVGHMFRVRIVSDSEAEEERRRAESAQRIRRLMTNRAEDGSTATATVTQRRVRSEERVGRNDPCPCGSGKKYKRCCGR